MKRPFFSWFILILGLIAIEKAMPALPLSFQNSPNFSIENLKKFMEWYTKNPHPMGTIAQAKLANELKQTLTHMGLSVQEMQFSAEIPNYNAKKLGGDLVTSSLTTKVTGRNIIATKKGKENCSVILGGHYDTKYFKDFKFVGANDGGSSTVLLLELARVMQHSTFAHSAYASACDLHFVFFDGEEAFLTEWNWGQHHLGIQDNTYGSTAFVKSLVQDKKGNYFLRNKKLEFVVILDMVGHKKQQLSITNGSHIKLSEKLLQNAKNVNISKVDFSMEDDHTPFSKANIPFIHIIDWKNLDEWHTSRDTIQIISFEAIQKFGEVLKQFLASERLQNNG